MRDLRDFFGLSYYVSELDRFLKAYDKNHPKLSAAQRQEVEKYAHVYALRDTPAEVHETKNPLWDKF